MKYDLTCQMTFSFISHFFPYRFEHKDKIQIVHRGKEIRCWKACVQSLQSDNAEWSKYSLQNAQSIPEYAKLTIFLPKPLSTDNHPKHSKKKKKPF